MIKDNRVFAIVYYDKNTDFLVKHVILENCTLDKLVDILDLDLATDTYEDYLIGGYDINNTIATKLHVFFNVTVDYAYNAQIEQCYENDLIINPNFQVNHIKFKRKVKKVKNKYYKTEIVYSMYPSYD